MKTFAEEINKVTAASCKATCWGIYITQEHVYLIQVVAIEGFEIVGFFFLIFKENKLNEINLWHVWYN